MVGGVSNLTEAMTEKMECLMKEQMRQFDCLEEDEEAIKMKNVCMDLMKMSFDLLMGQAEIIDEMHAGINNLTELLVSKS